MTIHFEASGGTIQEFQTGVSLHSHTTHSKESLEFIYRYAAEARILRAAIRRGERQYRDRHEGRDMDLRRAWWTPPLAPYDAWKLESTHLRERFGLAPLVSISDHDDIEAGMSLRVLSECSDTPVSVEWTVPFRGTFFHIGLHNLPPGSAREVMLRLEEVTVNGDERMIASTLAWVTGSPETMAVFNHPCWDESCIGAERHRELIAEFVRLYKPHLHAVELNGLRPWPENQMALRFGDEMGLPVISGGDRHAREPNVILNLTNTRTFAEFVSEVRDGESQVLVSEEYLASFKLRVLRSLAEILEGRWTDRVFYSCDDGETRSLTTLFTRGQPTAVRVFTGGVRVLRSAMDVLRPVAERV